MFNGYPNEAGAENVIFMGPKQSRLRASPRMIASRWSSHRRLNLNLMIKSGFCVWAAFDLRLNFSQCLRACNFLNVSMAFCLHRTIQRLKPNVPPIWVDVKLEFVYLSCITFHLMFSFLLNQTLGEIAKLFTISELILHASHPRIEIRFDPDPIGLGDMFFGDDGEWDSDDSVSSSSETENESEKSGRGRAVASHIRCGERVHPESAYVGSKAFERAVNARPENEVLASFLVLRPLAPLFSRSLC